MGTLAARIWTCLILLCQEAVAGPEEARSMAQPVAPTVNPAAQIPSNALAESTFGEAPPGGDSMLIPAGSQEDVAIGERIYRKGIGANGKPIMGVRFGGIEAEGADIACESCHRRSGLGSVEGQERVLPIAGRFLFGTDGRVVVNMNARNLKGFNVSHDGYTLDSFAEVMRTGKSISGTELGPIMPRYQLSDSDMKGLAAYLRNLSKDWSPGVTRARIRFATVVTPEVSPQRRSAFLDTIRATVSQRNGNVVGKGQRTMNAAEFMLHTDRAWDLDVWELQGPPDIWGKQLDEHMQAQPVFALVSGLGEGTWAPVHQFCESRQVACWFPSVDVPPQTADKDFYSAYFSQGVALEARVLAKYLKQAKKLPKRLIQVETETAASTAGAEALQKALAEAKLKVRVENRVLKSKDKKEFDRVLKGIGSQDAVMLWLHPDDLAAASGLNPPAAPIYVSRYMIDSDKVPLDGKWLKNVRMLYPFQLPEQRKASLAYFNAWLSMRKLPLVDEAMQSEVFFAMSFLADSLMEMLDNVHRDYLMEKAENMLSQREGSKAEEESRDVNFIRLQPGGTIPDANSRFAAGQIKRIPRHIPGAKLSESGKKESTTAYPRLGLAPGQRFASKGAYVVRIADVPDATLVVDSDWIVP